MPPPFPFSTENESEHQKLPTSLTVAYARTNQEWKCKQHCVVCVRTHAIYGKNNLSITQKEHMNKAKAASEAILFVKRVSKTQT